MLLGWKGGGALNIKGQPFDERCVYTVCWALFVAPRISDLFIRLPHQGQRAWKADNMMLNSTDVSISGLVFFHKNSIGGKKLFLSPVFLTASVWNPIKQQFAAG